MYSISSINDNIKLAILHLPDYALITSLTAKRDIEKSATVFLLGKLFSDADIDLKYTTEGKPYLTNHSSHISISHSHDKLAIIANRQETTGIDIELIRDKVLKIKHKFLSDAELLEADNNIEKLITYWASKEALYKYYSLKEVDFIGKLIVYPFTFSGQGSLTGEINTDGFRKKLQLHYEKIEEYMLVYILNEIG